MERKWYKYPSIKIENLPPDITEIYGLQVEDTWNECELLPPGMEDRKEEVQQDDREEGKGQEGELEEKLWEVEEFLVTLVDNGRSVVARKDDLPLLPRSTKDFTLFLTELALKNVSPLRKADPDLLRQGREWLTERLGGGKELELHCIWNPDYRDGIVQVDTLTFQPPSDDHGDGQSGGPPSPESLVMDLYSGWEEPTQSEEDLLEGEEPQHEEPPPLDTNLPDRSGQMAAVDDCSVTESCVAYEEPTEGWEYCFFSGYRVAPGGGGWSTATGFIPALHSTPSSLWVLSTAVHADTPGVYYDRSALPPSTQPRRITLAPVPPATSATRAFVPRVCISIPKLCVAPISSSSLVTPTVRVPTTATCFTASASCVTDSAARTVVFSPFL
ncbi:uncharacterized protein LOC143022447 [Oratosquilla oratoria]|uniref:uncharacterized protein LOC143022447 n=1 Tax=Oratosquilla oratoria TaxID=337810 RepID=UPI003F76C249